MVQLTLHEYISPACICTQIDSGKFNTCKNCVCIIITTLSVYPLYWQCI